MQINEDLLDEMLEVYYNQNLNIAGPGLEEVVDNVIRRMPNAEDYDLEKSVKIYNNILLDEQLIVFYPVSRNDRGEGFYDITSKGRMVHNFGGFKIFRGEEKASKKLERDLKYRELLAAERSAKSSKSAAVAAWAAGFFAIFSFLYPIYVDLTEPKPLRAVDVRQVPLELEMIRSKEISVATSKRDSILKLAPKAGIIK